MVLHASDTSSAWKAFASAVERCGFPRAIYGLTAGAHRRDLGRSDQITVLHNMPADWLSEVVQGRLFERSPAVLWAKRHHGAAPWTRPIQRGSFDTLDEINLEHGVTAGITISFPATPLGGRAVLCLMSDPNALQGKANLAWERHQRELEALAGALHLRVLTLPRTTVDVALNHRHCEVLGLIGAGHSVAETAEVIGRTPKAVEKRLAEARRVLGADSTAEAVLRAAEMNLISVSHGHRSRRRIAA